MRVGVSECARTQKTHIKKKKGKVHTDLILCRIFCRFFRLHVFLFTSSSLFSSFHFLFLVVLLSSRYGGNFYLRRAKGETFRTKKKHLCLCAFFFFFNIASRCSLLLPLYCSVVWRKLTTKRIWMLPMWLKFVKQNCMALFFSPSKIVCVLYTMRTYNAVLWIMRIYKRIYEVDETHTHTHKSIYIMYLGTAMNALIG